MMHYNNVVVTILDAVSKKPFREYGHKRNNGNSSVDMVIPFDTEYMFKFKINDNTRYRLDLRIDGTLITDSIIISDVATLERFVDSNKRFKFVRSDNEAVADPDSKDNGKIEITLYPEKPIFYEPPICLPVYNKEPWKRSDDITFTCSSLGSLADMVTNPSNKTQTQSLGSILRSQSFSNSFNDLDRGATVEGSKSDQEFESTTWRGDWINPLKFVFNVKGKEVNKEIENGKFCHECGAKKVTEDSKFCHKCGTKLMK